ncbi:hypothetical protein LTR53_000526 [Teratosphaeriaceae sp. CCFEE 6253]|nr:hypothetical protein LTR53_000526 [Teratosphaeriaceae sp. CCFEE 6253]
MTSSTCPALVSLGRDASGRCLAYLQGQVRRKRTTMSPAASTCSLGTPDLVQPPSASPRRAELCHDDSCLYCELGTVDVKPLEEAKWCMVGNHSAMRVDFFQDDGSEQPWSCRLHRFKLTAYDGNAVDLEGTGREVKVTPREYRTYRTRASPGVKPMVRIDKWKSGLGKDEAAPPNARMPAVWGAVERHFYLPNHTTRPEILRRHLGNGLSTREIATIHRWARGETTTVAIVRKANKVRKQVGIMKQISAATPAVTNYQIGIYGMTNPNAREYDVTLASLGANVVKVPAPEDRGLLTQAILWAQEVGDTTSTMADVDTLARSHGYTFPVVNGVSVSNNPNWDQEARDRILAAISADLP